MGTQHGCWLGATILKWNVGQLYFIGDAVNMLDSREVDTLVNVILPYRPVLVVIDTLARCMIGGDENSAKDMGLFVASCDRVKGATGATMAIVHHSGKSGSSERGSSALRAACDAMIEVKDDDGLMTASCTKSKDGKGFADRRYRRVEIETGRTTPDNESETSCVLLPSDQVVATGTLSLRGRKLLETLRLESFKETGARSSVLQEVSELRSSTFFRTISDLMRAGYVRQSSKGDPYYITDRGVAAITPTTPMALPR